MSEFEKYFELAADDNRRVADWSNDAWKDSQQMQGASVKNSIREFVLQDEKMKNSYLNYVSKAHAYKKILQSTKNKIDTVFVDYDPRKDHGTCTAITPLRNPYSTRSKGRMYTVYRMNVVTPTIIKDKLQSWNNMYFVFDKKEKYDSIFQDESKWFNEKGTSAIEKNAAALLASSMPKDLIKQRMHARIALQDIMQASLMGYLEDALCRKNDKVKVHGEELLRQLDRIKEALYNAISTVCNSTSQGAPATNDSRIRRYIIGTSDTSHINYVSIMKQKVTEAFPPRTMQGDVQAIKTINDVSSGLDNYDKLLCIHISFEGVKIYITVDDNHRLLPTGQELHKTVVKNTQMPNAAEEPVYQQQVHIDKRRGITRNGFQLPYILTRVKAVQMQDARLKDSPTMTPQKCILFHTESIFSGPVKRLLTVAVGKWRDPMKQNPEFTAVTLHHLTFAFFSPYKVVNRKERKQSKMFKEFKKLHWDLNKIMMDLRAKEFERLKESRKAVNKATDEDGGEQYYVDDLDEREENFEPVTVRRGNGMHMGRAISIKDPIQGFRTKLSSMNPSVKVIASSSFVSTENNVQEMEKAAKQSLALKRMSTPTLSIRESQVVASATKEKKNLLFSSSAALMDQAVGAAQRIFA